MLVIDANVVVDLCVSKAGFGAEYVALARLLDCRPSRSTDAFGAVPSASASSSPPATSDVSLPVDGGEG